MSHDFLCFSTFSRNVKCYFKTVLKFFLGQIYHFEIAYYISQSFLAPYYYMLLKQDNQFYAKLEDEFEQQQKTMSLITTKKYAKVLTSAKNYLYLLNK